MQTSSNGIFLASHDWESLIVGVAQIDTKTMQVDENCCSENKRNNGLSRQNA
jgi:hypothetical protein